MAQISTGSHFIMGSSKIVGSEKASDQYSNVINLGGFMKRTVLAGLLALCSTNASATVICSGNIKNIAVRYTGEVRLVTSFQNGDWHFTICNVTAEWKGIPTDVCKMWASQAQVAYAADRLINIYYPDGTSCATLTGDTTPRPDWFILKPTP